jgi:hypothetical protein
MQIIGLSVEEDESITDYQGTFWVLFYFAQLSGYAYQSKIYLKYSNVIVIVYSRIETS